MKISVYSKIKSEEEQIGWYRGCEGISYYKNAYRKENNPDKFYYTLTFSHQFEYDDDSLYFAYCFPYTYTDMMNDIIKIETDPERQ